MILISHRGNIAGPNIDQENKPEYIQQALDSGYNVEVDVWFRDNKWFLGHDKPQYGIEIEFLKNNNIWCHAKNVDALYNMSHQNIIYFWHENDTVTLTSNGYLWTYPGKPLTPLSIAVLPEVSIQNKNEPIAGLCSDYISTYKV